MQPGLACSVFRVGYQQRSPAGRPVIVRTAVVPDFDAVDQQQVRPRQDSRNQALQTRQSHVVKQKNPRAQPQQSGGEFQPVSRVPAHGRRILQLEKFITESGAGVIEHMQFQIKLVFPAHFQKGCKDLPGQFRDTAATLLQAACGKYQ